MIRMDTKIPPIPFPMISRAIKKFSIIVFPSYKNLVTRLMTRPPAMTEAIWPDTLAPTFFVIAYFQSPFKFFQSLRSMIGRGYSGCADHRVDFLFTEQI